MEIKLECLDNLTDLLKRFGREVESEVSLEEIRRAVSLKQSLEPRQKCHSINGRPLGLEINNIHDRRANGSTYCQILNFYLRIFFRFDL